MKDSSDLVLARKLQAKPWVCRGPTDTPMETVSMKSRLPSGAADLVLLHMTGPRVQLLVLGHRRLSRISEYTWFTGPLT